ncbi:hypothetical protein TNCV_4765231 [Trichonephila clavipes]|nr:hypothetical protein TNCV_4765231 [Trichonephila clavipes]
MTAMVSVPNSVYATLSSEQMFQSGGQSDTKPPVLSSEASLLQSQLKRIYMYFYAKLYPDFSEFERGYHSVPPIAWGHGSLVIKVSDRGWCAMSSSPVPLKTRSVGERSMLNLSRAQTRPPVGVVW